MPSSEKKKKYDQAYHKTLKSVLLRFQKPKYEEIQAAAEKAKETVAGYIRHAIDMRIESESDKKEE